MSSDGTSQDYGAAPRVPLYRAIALLALLGALFGLLPHVFGLATGSQAAIEQLNSLSDWRAPACRSFFLLLVYAPACVVIGFVLGCALAESQLRVGPVSGMLLLPMLLGGGVGAFIFKLCFVDIASVSSALHDRHVAAFWLAMFSMLSWQYVPCVTFLCWLNCLQIGSQRWEFSVAHRLPFFERVADIYFPHCRNLLAYLFVLIGAGCASEYERSAVVFRASAGTGTEFFSHWLVRAYFTSSRVDPLMAGRTVLSFAAVFASIAVVLVLLLTVLGSRVIPWCFRRIVFTQRGHTVLPKWAGQTLLFALVGYVLMPLVPTLARGLREVDIVDTLRCVGGVLPPAAGTAAACAILSIMARFGWPAALGRFGVVSLVLCLAIATIAFVPPVGLAFTGMWWLSVCRSLWESPSVAVFMLWWVLLSVAAFPIFYPGYLAVQFVVTSEELSFQWRHHASVFEVLKTSFVARLWPGYALFGIFLYSFMWTEYPLTSLFSGLSTQLRSPVLELAIRVEGKGAQFNEAAAIVLQMALPLFIAVIGFGAWIRMRMARLRAVR